MQKMIEPETKQHHKVCGTCPFARNFEPTETPGGSPLWVWVAQHFMPFQVPCHECVDYEQDGGDPKHGWKAGAVWASQCVGFAQCRGGGGVGEIMPDEMLHEDFDPTNGVFQDIWGFWAHHRQISRHEALIEVRPDTIMAFCQQELMRAGRGDILGNTEGRDMEMVIHATRIAVNVWAKAMRKEFADMQEFFTG